MSDSVVEILVKRIMNGGFNPGERIYPDKLAKEFNLSLTPIREAIYKLKGEDLLEVKPRMGVYVTKPSVKELIEILDVRIVLETFAIDLIPEISQELINKLEENFKRLLEAMKSEDIFLSNEIDREFHEIIIKETKNGQLFKVYHNLNSFFPVARIFYSDGKRYSKNLSATKNGHREIVEAFIEKDKKKIKETVRHHLNDVKQRLIEGMES